MSKKVNNEQQPAIVRMSEAGEELLKRLVELYNSQIFVREGKSLREELLSCGIDAGACLSSVDMLAERKAKIEAADRAVYHVNRTVYIANSMLMLGFYTVKQVQPVVSYCGALLTALKQLLHSVPESRRIIRVKTPVNVVNSAVAAEEYADGGFYEVSTDDSEGFNDPV